MTIRKELIEAIGARYRNEAKSEKKAILDEFVSLTGYHRKHATRFLGTVPRVEQKVTVRDRVYDEADRQALIVLWESGDRICGKWLRPLIAVLIDPVSLLRDIRLAQGALSERSARGPRDVTALTSESPAIATYLQSLATASKEGKVRPTHQRKATEVRWWRT